MLLNLFTLKRLPLGNNKSKKCISNITVIEAYIRCCCLPKRTTKVKSVFCFSLLFLSSLLSWIIAVETETKYDNGQAFFLFLLHFLIFHGQSVG